jgi:phage terminase small subunit
MLTQKQENFALLLVSGCSKADAYRQAYNAENMADASIHVEASRLAANPKVALRLKELKREKDENRRMQAVRGLYWSSFQPLGTW